MSTINGGVEGLTQTLALELAPMRVNGSAPGHHRRQPVLGRASRARLLEGYSSRTPGGELATMADIVGATMFLLDNRGVSGTSLVRRPRVALDLKPGEPPNTTTYNRTSQADFASRVSGSLNEEEP